MGTTTKTTNGEIMELDDLKCCGNCEHFCNDCSEANNGGLNFPEPDVLCKKWKWDANTMTERIWNGRE